MSHSSGFQRRAFLTGVAALGVSQLPVAAADTVPSVIPAKDVTLKQVQEILDAASLDVSIDKDGDVMVEDGGLKTFFSLNTENKRLTMYSVSRFRETTTKEQQIELANRWNDQLIFVRFSAKNNRLWCDYSLSYKLGILQKSIVDSYRLFATVIKGAHSTQDPDDLLA